MLLLFTMLLVLYVSSKSPLLPFVLVSAFCARGIPQISWDPWPSITACHSKALCLCLRNEGTTLHRVIGWGPSVGNHRMCFSSLLPEFRVKHWGRIFSIQTFTYSPWFQNGACPLSSIVPGVPQSPGLLWLYFFRVSFLSSTRTRLQ